MTGRKPPAHAKAALPIGKSPDSKEWGILGIFRRKITLGETVSIRQQRRNEDLSDFISSCLL